MSLLVLLAVPLIGALLLTGLGPRARQPMHLATAGLTLVAAAGVVAAVGRSGAVTSLGGTLRADALSAWIVVLVALVGVLAALEAARDARAHGRMAERWFLPLFHLFVFTMLAAVTTDDVGIMWVAIEGTTLASVFLVNAERSRESLEAAYKYLLICSVGIALAFVGTVLVYFGDVRAIGHVEHALRWTTLLELAPTLPVDGQFPFVHLERKFMHLGFHIYDVGFQSPNVDAARPMVFTTTLLLLTIVVVLNLFAIAMRNRLRRRYATAAV